ncbi:indole-3-acetaldehyde oxidase [Cryptomeria japonica]|uniref:indole-3-acetaldehyde oxidase n=1 Tax=Cryptomeria japonica TaxID=3369 RepID=UPI0027DA9A0D|nr:indole-3-acetaldehyde oxidase [Cryptomeria japonica]
MYLDRKTDMIMSGGRHPIKANYTVGLKNDGKITALHVDLFIDAGFTVDFSPIFPYTINKTMMKYNWGAYSVDYKVCKTNLPSKSAMRGPGDTQGSFFAETIIEHVASILGLDSIVVREKNIHTLESAKLFYGSSVESPVSYTLPSIWEKLKQSASFYERTKNIREFNATNRWFKRGLSLVPCFYAVRLSSRPARVTIFEDGSIAVEVGGVELGQGIWTKVKQMTAYALGQLWPGLSADIMAKVRLFQSDSISLAHGGLTSGSTTSEESCEAVRHACDILVERLQPVQILLKKSNPNGFSWMDLIFQISEGKHQRTRVEQQDKGDIERTSTVPVIQAKSQSVDLSAQTYWVPDSSASQYLNYGAGASEVEIDLLSGATTILRTDIIYDCGRSLNPAVDLGQIEGAFVQGVGFFMTEEHHVDNNGKLVSDGTWTYKVPTIDTIPRKFNVEILNSPFHQKRILSSKASGEPPLLLAASVHCAIREAIRAARKELPTDNNKHFRMDTPASMDVIKSLCALNNVELYLKSLCISTKQ